MKSMDSPSSRDPAGKRPSVRRSSLVDQVTASLSNQITTGTYKDQELLPTEPQLIELFGVSRTVVREATRQLVSRGLVEVERGRGIRIVNHLHLPVSRSLELSLPDAQERLEKLLEVRQVIEPAVVRLAALRATPEDLARIRVVQDELGAATDAAAAVLLDVKFHRLLVQSAKNSIFELMLESVADLGRASRLATISAVGWQQAHQHHARILQAVEARDPDQAELAMAEHLQVTALHLRKHFSASR